MLPSCVLRESHAPRSFFSSYHPTCAPPPLSPNSHRISSFADPHPLTPLQSNLYKNRGGATHPVPAHRPLLTTALTLLDSTHTRYRVCVANKGLTRSLTSLESALTKYAGWRNPQSYPLPTAHCPLPTAHTLHVR